MRLSASNGWGGGPDAGEIWHLKNPPIPMRKGAYLMRQVPSRHESKRKSRAQVQTEVTLPTGLTRSAE